MVRVMACCLCFGREAKGAPSFSEEGLRSEPVSAGPSQSKAGKDVNLDGEKGTLPAEVECEESTRKRPVKQDTCSSACGDAQLSAQDSKSSPGEGEEPCRTSHANSLVDEGAVAAARLAMSQRSVASYRRLDSYKSVVKDDQGQEIVVFDRPRPPRASRCSDIFADSIGVCSRQESLAGFDVSPSASAVRLQGSSFAAGVLASRMYSFTADNPGIGANPPGGPKPSSLSWTQAPDADNGATASSPRRLALRHDSPLSRPAPIQTTGLTSSWGGGACGSPGLAPSLRSPSGSCCGDDDDAPSPRRTVLRHDSPLGRPPAPHPIQTAGLDTCTSLDGSESSTPRRRTLRHNSPLGRRLGPPALQVQTEGLGVYVPGIGSCRNPSPLSRSGTSVGVMQQGEPGQGEQEGSGGTQGQKQDMGPWLAQGLGLGLGQGELDDRGPVRPRRTVLRHDSDLGYCGAPALGSGSTASWGASVAGLSSGVLGSGLGGAPFGRSASGAHTWTSMDMASGVAGGGRLGSGMGPGGLASNFCNPAAQQGVLLPPQGAPAAAGFTCAEPGAMAERPRNETLFSMPSLNAFIAPGTGLPLSGELSLLVSQQLGSDRSSTNPEQRGSSGGRRPTATGGAAGVPVSLAVAPRSSLAGSSVAGRSQPESFASLHAWRQLPAASASASGSGEVRLSSGQGMSMSVDVQQLQLHQQQQQHQQLRQQLGHSGLGLRHTLSSSGMLNAPSVRPGAATDGPARLSALQLDSLSFKEPRVVRLQQLPLARASCGLDSSRLHESMATEQAAHEEPRRASGGVVLGEEQARGVASVWSRGAGVAPRAAQALLGVGGSAGSTRMMMGESFRRRQQVPLLDPVEEGRTSIAGQVSFTEGRSSRAPAAEVPGTQPDEASAAGGVEAGLVELGGGAGHEGKEAEGDGLRACEVVREAVVKLGSA